MEISPFTAALAGLLYDVGVFVQQAGEGPSEQPAEVAACSRWFAAGRLPDGWQADVLPESGPAGRQPLPLISHWVRLARALASPGSLQPEAVQPFPLRPVFSQMAGYQADWSWPLRRLGFTTQADLFPTSPQAAAGPEAPARLYKLLWQSFTGECRWRGLDPGTSLDLPAYLENLDAALQAHTWCVPSGFAGSATGVSLYDHLRSTAALSACLANDERDEAWCRQAWEDLRSGQDGQEAALLVSGDFSGIQSFLYTLASSGAAKSLRARSFYLQILCESIAQEILRLLGLPLVNLLYAGGGGFQLLAHVQAQQQLPGIEKAMLDRLLMAHRGELGLTLCWRPVRVGEFARFNQAREQVGEMLAVKKRRPFASASASLLSSQVGQPITSGGDPLRFCRVTGDDWDVDPAESKSRFVLSLEDLGRDLPHATHLVLRRVDPSPPARPHIWQEGLRMFGVEPVLVTPREPHPPLPAGGMVRVLRLDAQDVQSGDPLLESLPAGTQAVLVRQPVARLSPTGPDGQPLTFDDLAEKAQGIQRWGVLRMDVDNLGKLFRHGLGESASLDRFRSLSFGLRLFFEGWLPRLAGEDLGDQVSIQYSGGDDVFIVGAWNALPVFAQRVRDSFHQFTCQNPAFTLSAGIAVVEAKYPLYQVARQAGQAEEQAKQYRRPGSTSEAADKNAVSFLGHTCDWPSFSQAMHDAGRMAGWVRQGWAPSALLQTTLSIYQQVKQARAEARRLRRSKPVYGRWMWMAAYQFSRMLSSAQNDARSGIEEIQLAFLLPGGDPDRWGLAARWANYLIRGGETR